MENRELVVNKEQSRFELTLDAHTAFIDYKLKDETITLIHTEVPAALGGQGVGKKIVHLALDYIRDHNLKLIPLCPFVIAYLKRNPEQQQLLVAGYKLK